MIVLLNAGAEPAVRDSRGNTALNYLADGLAEVLYGEDQRWLFQLFLDRGLDVNVANHAGKTPLGIVLADVGQRSEQRDDIYGFTVPERLSEVEVDAKVFGMFEKAGTKWDMRDKEGRTLLHILARFQTKRFNWRWSFLVGKGLILRMRMGKVRRQ